MFATNLYTGENPVFASFCFYAAFLCLKLFTMSWLTAYQRFTKKIFSNPEDAVISGAKVKYDDPHVERVRRAHLNDLENIVPFLILGLMYVGINPSPSWAIMLFRMFAAARVMHTMVYAVFVVAQPARAIAHIVSMLISGSMAFSILSTFVSAM